MTIEAEDLARVEGDLTCDCSCEQMTNPDIEVVQHDMDCDRGPFCECGADERDGW